MVGVQAQGDADRGENQLTVPLVFASAGNGTWLAYLLATACTLLVALCIARFARESASPGSLYTYATSSLPPVLGSVAAWGLLLAYVATGASVVGGFVHYTNVVLREFLGIAAPAIPLAIFAVLVSIWIAYRDVKVSAQVMVYVELVSVLLISVVFVVLLWRRGGHFDPTQFALKGVHFSGVRLGLVLAMFSFVGFESATTLGEEAKHPLRTIPRAVIQSAMLSGLFFIAASYTEVLGFPASAGSLDQNAAPMSVLSTVAGIPRLGPAIDICAMVSMFACTLACVTAAARVLLLMARNGLAYRGLGKTHTRNETPHIAVLATGAATMILPVALAQQPAAPRRPERLAQVVERAEPMHRVQAPPRVRAVVALPVERRLPALGPHCRPALGKPQLWTVVPVLFHEREVLRTRHQTRREFERR